MRLRPYRSETDFEYIKKWVSEERIHALWSALLTPYPLEQASFQELLCRICREQGGDAFVYTEEDGQPAGFFVYSVNCRENTGYLRFIVVDTSLRGKGYGTRMLQTALRYAFDITEVESVGLCVFDVNEQAKHCYEKAGFCQEKTVPATIIFREEYWGRCFMRAFASKA